MILQGSYLAVYNDSSRIKIEGPFGTNSLTELGNIVTLYTLAWDGMTGFSKGFSSPHTINVSIWEEKTHRTLSQTEVANRLPVFQYQSIQPDTASTIYKYACMKQDLDRYFGGFTTDTACVKKVSLVLEALPGAKQRLENRNPKKKDSFFRADILTTSFPQRREFTGKPYGEFINRLKEMIESGSRLNFYDRTGIEGDIDISLSGKAIDEMDVEKITTELKQYGLILTKREEEVTELFIRL